MKLITHRMRIYAHYLLPTNSLRNLCINLLNSPMGHASLMEHYKQRGEELGSGQVLPQELERLLVPKEVAEEVGLHEWSDV